MKQGSEVLPSTGSVVLCNGKTVTFKKIGSRRLKSRHKTLLGMHTPAVKESQHHVVSLHYLTPHSDGRMAPPRGQHKPVQPQALHYMNPHNMHRGERTVVAFV